MHRRSQQPVRGVLGARHSEDVRGMDVWRGERCRGRGHSSRCSHARPAAAGPRAGTQALSRSTSSSSCSSSSSGVGGGRDGDSAGRETQPQKATSPNPTQPTQTPTVSRLLKNNDFMFAFIQYVGLNQGSSAQRPEPCGTTRPLTSCAPSP